MKAIILAAGVGSRLYQLTKARPKCLVRVYGKSILEYQIDSYLAAGLRKENIKVVAGYKIEMVDSLLNSKYGKITVINNEEYPATNNMYSLHLALEAAGDPDEDTVLVSNGDCIYDPAIIRGLVSARGANLVAADRGTFNDESMKIMVNNNAIRNISKEIARAEAWGTSIDLYSLSRKSTGKLRSIIADYIFGQQNKKLWTEVALQDLFQEEVFTPYDIEGKNWVEIDNMDDLKQADRLFAGFSIENKKCFVVDLDGTIYLGKEPIRGTIDFINRNIKRKDFYFLTNNTSKTPADYVERLRLIGIDIDDSNIISPHLPLVEYLSEKHIQRVHLVANTNFRQYLFEKLPLLELTSESDACQAVIVAYDTELTYNKLKAACLLLHSREVEFIATHCDKVCPTEQGPIPDIGSILALLETSAGRTPDIVFGKPSPLLLSKVRKKYSNEEIVIVGDRLYTDKVLADDTGIDFILVLSGETGRADVEDCESFPKLILDNLGELL